MNTQAKMVIKRVLVEAADAPHFFEWSDAQRLNWMIARAFEFGKATAKATRARKPSETDASPPCPLELVIHLRKPAKSKQPTPRRR
jgi:hypothetical protein